MKLQNVFCPLFFLLSLWIQTGHAEEFVATASAHAEVEKGMQALHANQTQEALRFFRQAKKLDANFAPAYVGEAEVLTLQNAWDEALALLNRAIQLAPEFGIAYHNRGVLYYYRKEYKKAYADLRKAIQLGETVDSDMLSQVWGAAFPEEMIEKMNEEISKNPRDAQAYLNRGIAHFYRNDYQNTLTDWNKAQELGLQPDPEMKSELEKHIQKEKHAVS